MQVLYMLQPRLLMCCCNEFKSVITEFASAFLGGGGGVMFNSSQV